MKKLKAQRCHSVVTYTALREKLENPRVEAHRQQQLEGQGADQPIGRRPGAQVRLECRERLVRAGGAKGGKRRALCVGDRDVP
eukprot:scaffold90756_cov63-Phaeocystis_antarctica.AAC.2